MAKVNLIESPYPLNQIKGIGPKRLAVLQELNINTVEDLVLYLPTRYEDNTVIDLNEAEDQSTVTVQGEVYSSPTVAFFGRNKSKLTVHIMVNQIAVKCVFFNQPYLKKKIELNGIVTVKGKWNRAKQEINGNRMFFNQQDNSNDTQLEPVYRIKEGIKQKQLRDNIRQSLDDVVIHEWLSDELRTKYKLETLDYTLKTLHHPKSKNDLLRARRTYAFTELFMFELRMQWLNRLEKTSDDAIEIKYDIQKVKSFIDSLPFELTDAQKSSVNEIFRDLKAPIRMHRLLQGDVGSGKTVVAAICMYALKTAGYQSALMVPTEILAEQHAESLIDLFGETMNVALLTGSVKGKRRILLEQLENGTIDCLIGTHALIQDDVTFENVGLVITDEQHRFGVNQRQRLREKGAMTNVLFMTATPIPRTLAISVFGEMDVSSIKQLPKGRKPIITSWAKHEQYEQVLTQMTSELKKGRQAYVICPLIESSEHLEDVQNVVELYESLQQYYGQNKVGLLHGKLTNEEKDEVMHRFSQHEIDILVSTTVVEVGVNVPNATFMMIYDADRFGLSTLHQLRGRVGRSEHQSYCVLIASPKTETGIERMTIMTQTTDGFELSERDLEMRGPGDFFGVKQSGLPDFLVANIVEDYRMLEVARDEAGELIQSGEFFNSNYDHLRHFIEDNLLDMSFD